MTATDEGFRRVTALVTFDVPEGVTDEDVDYILGTLYAQVDGDAVVGYSDDLSMNELMVPVRHAAVTLLGADALDPRGDGTVGPDDPLGVVLSFADTGELWAARREDGVWEIRGAKIKEEGE